MLVPSPVGRVGVRGIALSASGRRQIPRHHRAGTSFGHVCDRVWQYRRATNEIKLRVTFRAKPAPRGYVGPTDGTKQDTPGGTDWRRIQPELMARPAPSTITSKFILENRPRCDNLNDSAAARSVSQLCGGVGPRGEWMPSNSGGAGSPRHAPVSEHSTTARGGPLLQTAGVLLAGKKIRSPLVISIHQYGPQTP